VTPHPIAYIAAPYAGDEPLNLARADAFGLAVASLGRAVLIPHRAIGQGRPDTPETRPDALARCLAAVEGVWYRGGELHVLERDDGTLSEGCALEVEAWRARGGAEIRWRWVDGAPVRVQP